MTILSVGDANQLFVGTIIIYEGKMGYVRDTSTDDEGNTILFVRFVGEERNRIIPADPDEIHCPTAPYRLGYVQYTESSCRYLVRTPARQYSVGWSNNNVVGLDTNALLRGRGSVFTRFEENMRGKYPSYQEALEQARTNSGVVAFDRQFAVNHGTYLQYKGRDIAYIRDNGDVDLPRTNEESMEYLLKMAMEAK